MAGHSRAKYLGHKHIQMLMGHAWCAASKPRSQMEALRVYCPMLSPILGGKPIFFNFEHYMLYLNDLATLTHLEAAIFSYTFSSEEQKHTSQDFCDNLVYLGIGVKNFSSYDRGISLDNQRYFHQGMQYFHQHQGAFAAIA